MPNVIISPSPAQQVTEWRIDRIILTPRSLDPTDGVTIIQDYSAIIMIAYLNSNGTVHHYENVVTTDVSESIAYFEALAGSTDESLIESRTAEWLVSANKVPDSVTCPYIFLNPEASPVFTANNHNAVTITPTSGTAPYMFNIVSGAFPDGVTLNTSSGIVSGTATTMNEIWNVVINAEDAEGCISEDRSYSGNTTSNATAVDVQPVGALNISVGVPFSQSFTATGDGLGPNWNWSISGGALPPGLSWIDGSGTPSSTIQGTPTGVGAPYNTVYVITAMDINVEVGGQSEIFFVIV